MDSKPVAFLNINQCSSLARKLSTLPGLECMSRKFKPADMKLARSHPAINTGFLCPFSLRNGGWFSKGSSMGLALPQNSSKLQKALCRGRNMWITTSPEIQSRNNNNYMDQQQWNNASGKIRPNPQNQFFPLSKFHAIQKVLSRH